MSWKTLTAWKDRKQSVDDVPSLPRTPTASTTPSFDEHGTHGGFSVNQTDSLDYVAHAGPAVSATKELIVSGVSFMDLSDSSGDEEYQVSYFDLPQAQRRQGGRHLQATGVDVIIFLSWT